MSSDNESDNKPTLEGLTQSKGYIRQRGAGYQVIVSLDRGPITKRYRRAYEYAATYEAAVARRDELVKQVAEGRDADTKATVGLLLDRWLAVADLSVSTRHVHEGFIERTIRPALGDMPLRKLQQRVDSSISSTRI